MELLTGNTEDESDFMFFFDRLQEEKEYFGNAVSCQTIY